VRNVGPQTTPGRLQFPRVRHTYNSIHVHCVFAGNGRRAWFNDTVRQRLYEYLAVTARRLGMHLVRAGGTPDHVHLLLRIPASMSVAVAIQKLKANSSRWLRTTFPETRLFAWQEGYGAFSIGASQVNDTVAYIDAQMKHHAHLDFAAELRAFLRRHGFADLPSARCGLSTLIFVPGTHVPR
jgi:putative transposase